MEFDLESMSLDALKSLRRNVLMAIETFESQRRSEALAAAERAAREKGFTLAELMGPASARKAKSRKGEAKYVHPDNPNLTWSGRGRKPGWIKAFEASGRSREEFSI